MEFELKIKNFSSISKRRDIKNPSWFALDNDIFTHPDFFNISSEGFKVYIWILCVGSKVNAEKIRINCEVCAYQLKLDVNVVVATIEYLDGKRWHVTNAYADVTCTSRGRDGHVRLDVTHTTDTTNKHNKQTQQEGKKIKSECPMIDLWNICAVSVSKVLKSNPSRNQKIKDIWPSLSEDDWRAVFERINNSEFCAGKNDRGWKATFDWILKKETYLKVMEGTYDNRKNNKQHFGHERTSAEASDEFNELIREAAK